jgi:type IV secretory pathway VirB4 component
VKHWTHWGTSLDVTTLRLPAHDAGTGLNGRPLGRAVFGGSFVLDPLDAYQAQLVTNANAVVVGSIGAGKSTVVKMTIDRALERGRRAVVIDPKGEYADLAATYGVQPLRLGLDGWVNPLEGPGVESERLVTMLVEMAKGAPIDADERFVLSRTWERVSQSSDDLTVATVYEALAPTLESPENSAQRRVALALHRYVSGDLAGIVSGTTPPLVLDQQLCVIDVSAQWSSTTFAIVALCSLAIAQSQLAGRGERGYLVFDEAWALLAHTGALEWIRGSWKLARSKGIAHVLVLHRWSDVVAVGDEGSHQRELAQGLLRDCELVYLLRQPVDEAREIAEALGLHPTEERQLVALVRGQALIRYGRHRSVVVVEPDERDRRFIDTDAVMRQGQ